MRRLDACIGVALALGSGLPAHAEVAPTYGADVSMGLGVGSLMSEWSEQGVHGLVSGRYDAFVSPFDAGGPRMGVSLFASTTAGILQSASETVDNETTVFPFQAVHTGVLSILRHDAPGVEWSGLTGFGFGRLDLVDYYDGFHTLPTITFEAGVRRVVDHERGLFGDGLIRASWATTRGLLGERSEWWCVQTLLSVGVHAR